MGQIRWNPEWDTGFPVIDEQHRRLVVEFNDFLEAVTGDFHGQHVANLIEFLRDLLNAHCEEEEFQMRATRYPRLAEHIAFHDQLRATADSLSEISNKDPEVFTAEVMAFLQDWVKHHIQGEDSLLARHLLQCSQKGARPES